MDDIQPTLRRPGDVLLLSIDDVDLQKRWYVTLDGDVFLGEKYKWNMHESLAINEGTIVHHSDMINIALGWIVVSSGLYTNFRMLL